MTTALLLVGFALGAPAGPCDTLDAILEEARTLRLRGALDEALAFVEDLLTCDGLEPDDSVALWLEAAKIHDRFGLHNNTRPVAAALEAIDAAAGVATAAGALARARVELARATYHYRVEAPARAFPVSTGHVNRAIEEFEALDEQRDLADAVHLLGLIHFYQREYAEARVLFDRSLALDRAAGARRWFCGEYHRHIAFVDSAEGRLDAAIPHFEKSLRCRIESGAIDASLFAAVSLGSTLVRAGRADEAGEALAHAQSVAAEIESPVGRIRAGMALGQMHEALGDPAAARAAYREVATIAATVDATSTVTAAEEAIARLASPDR